MDATAENPLNMVLAQKNARDLAEWIAVTIAYRTMKSVLGVGRGDGERGIVAAGRAPVDLVTIRSEGYRDRGDQNLTPLGWHTARVRLPALLEALGRDDRRVRAAMLYMDRVERVGSMPGCDLAGGSGGGGLSDGGAVTRAQVAGDLRVLRSCLIGMALPVRVAGGARRAIPLRDGVDQVVLGRSGVEGVLRRFGWSNSGQNVKALSGAILGALEGMAVKMGY